MNNAIPTVRPPIAILGVPFDNLTTAEAVVQIESMVASGRPHYVVTANVDFVVQAQTDLELRRIFFDAHVVLCDGTPLVWASRFMGNPLLERVAGADVVPLLIQKAAEKGYRLFFLGATPDSAGQAVERLKHRFPSVQIAGHYSPPFNRLLEMDHEEITRRIRDSKPDMLFVAFGCPKAEKWIAMHYRSLGVPVVIGVGATIDFLAGRVKRAPIWMQQNGLEWVFRLMQEPRRLLGRYAKDIRVFGWSILCQWWRLRPESRKAETKQSWIRREAMERHPEGQAGATSAVETKVNGFSNGCLASSPTLRTPCDSGVNEAYWLIQFPERVNLVSVCGLQGLLEETASDGRHCVIDVSTVRFIDSSGAALLMRTKQRLHAADRHLILLSPTQALLRALKLMRLEEFFAIAPDARTAELMIEARASEQCAVVEFQSAAIPLAWRGEITAANVERVWEKTHKYLEIKTVMTGGGFDSELPRKFCTHLRIDISKVSFVDSAGLGLMIRAKKCAERNKVTLAFLGIQPAVRNLLRFAELEDYLEAPASRANRDAAIAIVSSMTR